MTYRALYSIDIPTYKYKQINDTDMVNNAKWPFLT